MRSGLALLLLLSGVSPAGDQYPRLGYRQAGIDSTRIAELFRRTAAGEFPGVDAIVITRHGALVAESYFNGYDANRRHDIRSATKSITSLLVGIAVDQAKLSLDTAVVPFFPDYRPASGWDSARSELRLRHLLTMRTGLACDDFVDASPGNEAGMYPLPDWTRFFFAIPAAPEPAGAKFSYCTAGVVLTGELLARAVHESVADYAERMLWKPLGVKGVRWSPTPTGGVMTGGNLELTPREMARIGQLMLDHGKAGGRQVVIPSGHASGNGGQKIFIFPSADLVVVFTGSNYNRARLSHQQPVQMLNQYILPALTS